MASTPNAYQYIPQKTFPYFGFTGIDRSRPRSGSEDGEGQSFWNIENGYSDWRGTLRREPAMRRLKGAAENARYVHSLKFYNRGEVIWAERTNSGLILRTQSGANYETFDPKATVTFGYYRNKVIVYSAGYRPLRFDGGGFISNFPEIYPGFGVTIQGRLAVAGMPNEPTVVSFSRTGDETTFLPNETDTSSSARAAIIDIANNIDTADFITGLGQFEANRLAVFTNDQVLIYVIEPSITNWALDQRARVQVGCISHRTIANIGTDLIFCSRHGVHILSRAIENGVSLTTLTLSLKIQRLYREMLQGVENLSDINAYFDQDKGRYHIFFPKPGGYGSKRLTLNVETGIQRGSWAIGTNVSATCGDTLAGREVWGAPDGLYEMLLDGAPIPDIENNQDDFTRGQLAAETPILWQGAIEQDKTATDLIVQASGRGTLRVTAYDEAGQTLTSVVEQIEARDDASGHFPDTPLEGNYTIPFPVTYRGVQLRFESEDQGDINLMGFAIKLRDELMPLKRR